MTAANGVDSYYTNQPMILKNGPNALIHKVFMNSVRKLLLDAFVWLGSTLSTILIQENSINFWFQWPKEIDNDQQICFINGEFDHGGGHVKSGSRHN